MKPEHKTTTNRTTYDGPDQTLIVIRQQIKKGAVR